MKENDLLGIDQQDNAVDNEQQEKYRQLISQKLQAFFGVKNAKELVEIYDNGMTDKERVVLKTAIQAERPIDRVDVFSEKKEVKIDGKKGGEEVIAPEGTLMIEYGRAEENSSDLTVYIFKDQQGQLQIEVLARAVDYKKEIEDKKRIHFILIIFKKTTLLNLLWDRPIRH